jgi:hypothetical protein
MLDHPNVRELHAQLLEVPSPGEVIGELTHDDDRRRVPNFVALGHRLPAVVEDEPPARFASPSATR